MFHSTGIAAFTTGIALFQFSFSLRLLLHDKRRAAHALALLFTIFAWYTFGSAMQYVVVGPSAVKGWQHFQFVFIPFIPFALINFVQSYYRVQTAILRFFNGLFLGLGLAFVVLQFTFPFHSLFYSNMTYQKIGPFAALAFTAHTFYHLHTIIQLFAACLSVLYFVQMLVGGNPGYRKQSALLLVSILIPLGTALGVLSFVDTPHVDVVPYALFLSTLIFLYLYQTKLLFTAMPVDTQLVFDALQDGIILLDQNQTILDYTPIAKQYMPELNARLLGHTVQEAAGTVFLLKKYVQKVANDGSVKDPIVSGTDANGHPLYVEIRQQEAPEQGLVVLVIRDISERYRLFSELQESYHKLSELNKLQNTVIQIIAHDLRAPLITLKTFLTYYTIDMLSQDPVLWEQATHELDELVDRADGLLQNLLVVGYSSRCTTTSYPLAVLDIASVIDALPTSLYRYAEKKRVAVSVTLEDTALIHANANLLGTALRNILNNAIKYSEAGKTVRLVVEIRTESVSFRVSDEGKGFSKEALAAFQADVWGVEGMGAAGENGSAMGLFAAKKCMQLQKGTLEVQPRTEGGSEVSLTIPRAIFKTKIRICTVLINDR